MVLSGKQRGRNVVCVHLVLCRAKVFVSYKKNVSFPSDCPTLSYNRAKNQTNPALFSFSLWIEFLGLVRGARKTALQIELLCVSTDQVMCQQPER